MGLGKSRRTANNKGKQGEKEKGSSKVNLNKSK
jgi:hypothetical protein